jgi:hypothetical protein
VLALPALSARPGVQEPILAPNVASAISRAGRDIRPFQARELRRIMRPQVKNRRDGYLL